MFHGELRATSVFTWLFIENQNRQAKCSTYAVITISIQGCYVCQNQELDENAL